MPTIFGPELHAITWSDVAAFLDGATVEPLTWEGKADDVRGKIDRRDIVKTIAAFANSERGGYLVLGARKVDGVWGLHGLRQPPSDELATWVSQLADQVSPRPSVDGEDLKAPIVEGLGPAAVIWIPPVSEPPAITADGGLYVRVAGASVPISDPRVLSELYGRTVAARADAVERSRRAMNPASRAKSRYFSVGAAAIGRGSGSDLQIYSRGRIKALKAIALDTVGTLHNAFQASEHMTHEKSWVMVSPPGPDTDLRTEVCIHRDRSVSVHFWADWATSNDALGPVLDAGYVPLVAAAVQRALQLVGASGPMHLLWSASRRPGLEGHHAEISRWWSADEAPSSAEIESVIRDLRRTAGTFVVEPDD